MSRCGTEQHLSERKRGSRHRHRPWQRENGQRHYTRIKNGSSERKGRGTTKALKEAAQCPGSEIKGGQS